MTDDFPTRLVIGGGLFGRVDSDPPKGDRPGQAYAYDTGAGPGLARSVRVCPVRCPACRRPLRSTGKGECLCTGCKRAWYPSLVNEPGRGPLLVLTDQRP